MPKRIRGVTSATLLAAASAILPLSAAAQEVPKQLQPPANEQLLLRVHAKTQLVKEGLKTIVFEQLAIIRRIEIHRP